MRFPDELDALPPVPVHPPVQATQDELTYASPSGHCVQLNGLFAPLLQVGAATFTVTDCNAEFTKADV
jgi:hypothetical protein